MSKDSKHISDILMRTIAQIPRLSDEQLERRMAEDTSVSIRDGWLDDVSSMPRMRFARFENAAWLDRLHPKLAKKLASWEAFNRGLVVLGPTGAGKTSGLVAAMWRLKRVARRGGLYVPGILPRFLWTSEARLVNSVREHRLGAGAVPLIVQAQRVQHLIIDEFGYGADPDLMHSTIVDERYGRGLPTTITSGLTLQQLADRYTLAFVRRLAQLADVVDLHEVSS